MDQSRPEYRHAWKEDGGWTLQDHVVKFVVGVAEVNLRDGGLWHMWNPRRFDLNLDVEVVLARVAFLTLIAVQFVIFDDMEVLCEGYGGLPWHWYWTQEPENGALTVREQVSILCDKILIVRNNLHWAWKSWFCKRGPTDTISNSRFDKC